MKFYKTAVTWRRVKRKSDLQLRTQPEKWAFYRCK